MIESGTFILFLGASIVVTLAPGPDNLFVITQGIVNGRKSALYAAWGMISGISIHILLAAFGVSALIYSSKLVFDVFKIAGAGYLFYLAWSMIRQMKDTSLFSSYGNSDAKSSLYRRGFLMNVLNPKVALFFLAFLPQFVDVNTPNYTWAMVSLGFIFMAQAFVIFSSIAVFSGRLNSVLKEHKNVQFGLSIAAAITFTFFGVKLLFA